MNVMTPASRGQHPFLTGKPKRLFIDGKWVEAASGKTFATLNPATRRRWGRSSRLSSSTA